MTVENALFMFNKDKNPENCALDAKNHSNNKINLACNLP
jgi:hypothetical protein